MIVFVLLDWTSGNELKKEINALNNLALDLRATKHPSCSAKAEDLEAAKKELTDLWERQGPYVSKWLPSSPKDCFLAPVVHGGSNTSWT